MATGAFAEDEAIAKPSTVRPSIGALTAALIIRAEVQSFTAASAIILVATQATAHAMARTWAEPLTEQESFRHQPTFYQISVASLCCDQRHRRAGPLWSDLPFCGLYC